MKHIDLLDEIADAIHWDATVADTLKWLDDHPDQAPGGTITESKFQESLEETFGSKYEYTGRAFLEDLGIPIVDDPERTDEDRMISDLDALADGGLYLGDLHRGKIAQKLTELGWTKEGDES